MVQMYVALSHVQIFTVSYFLARLEYDHLLQHGEL